MTIIKIILKKLFFKKKGNIFTAFLINYIFQIFILKNKKNYKIN